ncbi:hypothetical protein N7520_007641 [Penicillium odoratum]|uniref:uncharacterized protein n=1 Tax=Penicillium odoratum TaxID=1167516 RepID=UPI002547BF97|nr:uncharacterized protein N7520_007641 [Penicillium odoratum]KAJ5760485.1 hypothetical protein N7520_007641 [Penicillium odoratum]
MIFFETSKLNSKYLRSPTTNAHYTADARRTWIQRKCETPFKDIVLVGLPRPTEALVAISRVKPEDEVEQTFTREGWQCDETNHT